MAELPTGTVTFLFTDLEGSTRVWEERREAMAAAVERHDELLEDAITAHRGVVFSHGGDGLAAAFATASDAVAAAVDAQLALASEPWGETGALRSRMGVHTGEGRIVGADGNQYESHTLNRCARLMAVAHGEQLVLSSATAELVHGALPAGCELVDLGEHRLRDLQSTMHVYQVVAPGMRSTFPALRSLDSRPGNLPRQVTTFVGRTTELELLTDLVRETSLVTLTGVGGVGKTRLALQVAAEAVADFTDGAWLCELAPVTDPAAVWEVLAGCLGAQASPGRSIDETVLDYLALKRLLLVLDNCEHLLDTVARVASAISQRCASVSVLATSREGIAVAGERIVAVPSLDVPTDDNVTALLAADAVQLFTDRARAAKHDFALDDHNIAAMGELCRRLDGIPLAIELAAARVRTLSPDDLVARLDQRFKLLTRGSRAALERHQTLRSTIDWSYDLLDASERRALDRLSVFAGSCDLAAAEAVLAGDDLDAIDVADVLSQLVDKSLVLAEDQIGHGVRFRLFESIRQYAAERLEADGETAAVRRRHADHYVGFAETAGPHLRSRDQIEWAAAVLREVDNFRAVLDWAVETPSPEHALRLVAPFTVTGLAIGDAARDWAGTACAIPASRDRPLYPTVAGHAALAAAFARDFERAEALAAAAVEAEARLGTSSTSVLRAQGVIAFFQGNLDEAQQHATRWVALASASGDTYELSHALLMLAAPRLASDYDLGAATFDEALQVARDAGNASALSIALTVVAGLLPSEESERALALLDEALELGNRVGDNLGVAQAIIARGAIAFKRGDWSSALRAAVDAAERRLQQGDLTGLSLSFNVGGAALYGLGSAEAAFVLIAKSDTMGDRLGDAEGLQQFADMEAELRASLGPERVATLTAEGAGMSAAEAVEYLRVHAERVLEAAT